MKKHEDVITLMDKLGGKIPATMSSFGAFHKASVTISSKTKKFITLAIALVANCDGCIAFHVHDALENGATSKKFLETIGVAICKRSELVPVYSSSVIEALEQFKTAKK
jgi:AhpD family alkylhydroperoxidase